MQHPDAELLAAVALGEHPEGPVGPHLAECPACRAEVDELAHVADALPCQRLLGSTPTPALGRGTSRDRTR